MNSYPLPTGFSKKYVNKLGEKVRSGTPDELDTVMDEIALWRSSFAYPLNDLKTSLDKIAKGYPHAMVAQRLKRMESIVGKLRRFPDMDLGGMQDIAGARVILDTIDDVYAFSSYLESKASGLSIKRHKNYIESPKPDGYRGIHLITEYHGETSEAAAYNGMQLEIQVRTGLQHVWATTVESAGVVAGTDFKIGEGGEDWRRFLKLLSDALALADNTMAKTVKAPLGDAASKLLEMCKEVAAIDRKCKIYDKLSSLTAFAKDLQGQKRNGKYFILVTDPVAKITKVMVFSEKEYELATEEYHRLEEENQYTAISQVLVSADDVKILPELYPNYFRDMTFTLKLIQLLESHGDKKA